MSVDADHYVVYGIHIPWDKAFVEDYFEAEDNHRGVEAVLDGMMAEYVVFGKVLARGGQNEDTDFKEIDLGQLPKYEIEYKEKFRKTFPNYAHLMDKPFKLIAFTHYS